MATIKIGMDIGDLKAKAAEFQEALASNGGAIDDFLVKGAKFNERNKPIQATIQTIGPSGQTVEQVIKRDLDAAEKVDRKWRLVSTTVKAATDQVKDFGARQKEVAALAGVAAASAAFVGPHPLPSPVASAALVGPPPPRGYSEFVGPPPPPGYGKGGAGDVGGDAVGKSKELFISWQGIFRLLQSAVIRRAFYAIIQQSTQAIQTFASLSVEIGRVQAITQEAGLSTTIWAQRLRDLSDSYNVSLVDTTAAAYELLRTRVVDAAGATGFLSRALELSEAYGLSAKDSVHLLTQSIQTFGLQSGEVNRVVAVLSQSVERGNVNLTEYAHGIAHLGPVAKQLGLSIEETAAAVSTLTTQGVRTASAVGLVQSVVQKLLRPTEEMKKLFREWGVATGEQAVAAFGLAGVLERLGAEAQKGGLSKVAELEKEFRSISGAIGLSKGAFAGFADELDRVSEAQGRLGKTGEIVKGTYGYQFQQALKKINNVFTVDIAADFVTAAVKWTQPVGGLAGAVEKLTGAIKLAVAAVVAFGVAVVTVRILAFAESMLAAARATSLWPLSAAKFTAGMSAMTASVGTFVAANRVMLIQLGITAAILGALWLDSAQRAREAQVGIDHTTERERKELDDSIRDGQRKSDTERAAFKRNHDEKLRIVLNYFALVRAELNKQQDETLRKHDPLTEALSKDFEEELRKYKKAILDLKQFITEVAGTIKVSQKREIDIGGKSDLATFERSLVGATEKDKFERTLDKVHSLQESAAALFNRGINTFNVDNIEAARKKLDEVDTLLKGIDPVRQITQNIKQSRTTERRLRDRYETENFNYTLRQTDVVGSYLQGAPVEVAKASATLGFAEKLKADAKKLFAEGVRTFNVDNIEEARKKLEEVDKLYQSLLDKQLSFRQKAAKLGVLFSTPALGPGGGVDSLRLENQRVRLKLEQDYRDSQVAQKDRSVPDAARNTQIRIDLERKFQEAQTLRVNKALLDERRLNEVQKKAQETQDAYNSALERQTKARKTRDEGSDEVKQNFQQYQNALTDLNKYQLALRSSFGRFLTKAPVDPKLAEKTDEEFRKLGEIQELYAKDPNKSLAIFKHLQEQAGRAVESLRALTQAQEDQEHRPSEAGRVKPEPIKINGVTLDDLEASVKKYRDALDKSFDKRVQGEQDLAQATKEYDGLSKVLEAVPEKYRRIGEEARKAAEEQRRAVDDLLETTRKSLESIRQLQESAGEQKAKSPSQLELPPVPERTKPTLTPAQELLQKKLSFLDSGADLYQQPSFEPQYRSTSFDYSSRSQSSASSTSSVSFGDINVTIEGGGSTERQAREIAQMIRREVIRGNSLLG